MKYSSKVGDIIEFTPRSKTIKNENVVMCDIDDTLVMHLNKEDLKKYTTVEVQDTISGNKVLVGINEPMVRLVKEEWSRGSHIIIWSRGGYQWATNVIQALDLDSYVHQIMSKPIAYFDDKDISEWLKYRVYLSPDTVYKNVTKTKEKK